MDKFFRESAFANAAQIAGFPVLIGLALFGFGAELWRSEHFPLANLFFAFGALFTAVGIVVFVSVLWGRVRLPRVPEIDVERSFLARVITSFNHPPFPGATSNGYIYHLASLELTNRERFVMLVRLELNVSINGKDVELEASAPCRQEGSSSGGVQNLALGLLPHLPPDIRLDPTVPFRGHTEFVVHPILLRRDGSENEFGKVRLTITDVISKRKKTMDL